MTPDKLTDVVEEIHEWAWNTAVPGETSTETFKRGIERALSLDTAPAGDDVWRDIETVPMDGTWVWLLGFDGSDFESENKPRLDCAIAWRTRWVQPRDEEWFEPVESGLYARRSRAAAGYWHDIPGQLEYVYGWRPYTEPSITVDDPVLLREPLDTRGDDFNKLCAALKATHAVEGKVK